MFGSAKYGLHGSAQAPAGYTSPHDDWLAGVLYPGHGRAWPVPHPRISRGGLAAVADRSTGVDGDRRLHRFGHCAEASTGRKQAFKHRFSQIKGTDFHGLRAPNE
jgi:hypothetical protein